jgi:hypothetical protein
MTKQVRAGHETTRLVNRDQGRSVTVKIAIGLAMLAATLSSGGAQAAPPLCRPNFVITKQPAAGIPGCNRTIVGADGQWSGQKIEERAGQVFCHFAWKPKPAVPMSLVPNLPLPIGPAPLPAPPPSSPSGGGSLGPPGGGGSGTTAPGAGTTTPGPIVIGGTPADLRITPALASFGTAIVGESRLVNLALKNQGGSVTNLNFAALAPQPHFSLQASNCPATLAAGQSCTVTVKFKPTAAGTFTQTLTSAQVSHLHGTVRLVGVGVSAPSLQASHSYRQFGTILPQGASADNTIDITNIGQVGSGPLTLTVLSGTGGTKEFKIVSHTCNGSLPPAATCAVVLRFVPTA